MSVYEDGCDRKNGSRAVSELVAEAAAVLTAAARRKEAAVLRTRPSLGQPPRPPSVVSDEQLLAIYRKQLAESGPGAGAAAHRIRMLEERLRQEPPP